MALLSTYTSANRVLEEALHTTYSRETIKQAESEVGAAYLKYTRVRTKRYKYVGLTQSAALTCANDLNLIFQRKIFAWVWDATNRIWVMNSDAVNENYLVLSAGNATPTYSAGCAWDVNVEVNEEITIPYRTVAAQASSALPSPWTDFESNPAMLTNAFKGFNDLTRTDFDYDE